VSVINEAANEFKANGVCAGTLFGSAHPNFATAVVATILTVLSME
jgi:hypothetical protein